MNNTIELKIVELLYENTPEIMESAISRFYHSLYFHEPEPGRKYEEIKHRFIKCFAAKFADDLSEAIHNIDNVGDLLGNG
jgi:hypothetical protein